MRWDATMGRKDYCCQVDQFCKAPPDDYSEKPVGPFARATCYACGLAVCVNCSLVTSYHGEKRRLCHDCHIDYAESDVTVMKHLWKLAGYDPKQYPKQVPG